MSKENCRERIREMLKIKITMLDIMVLCLQEFNLKYQEIKKILFEEVQNEKDNRKTN